MFEGEKTRIFWIGLVILGLSSTILFTILWYTVVVSGGLSYWDWRYLVPPIVGAVVFILIGLYMMKSGVKKKEQRAR